MQRLELRQIKLGHVLAKHDQKIYIAVDIEITDCERALQICADKIVSQNTLNAQHELTQEIIQIRIRRGLFVNSRTSGNVHAEGACRPAGYYSAAGLTAGRLAGFGHRLATSGNTSSIRRRVCAIISSSPL